MGENSYRIIFSMRVFLLEVIRGFILPYFEEANIG